MTPRTLLALLDRKIAGDLQRDYRAGTVAAAVCNAQGGVNGKALSAADFFPRLKDLERGQTAEDHAAVLDQIAAFYPSES